MTLRIELPEEKTAALTAKARSKGLSPEEYARQLVEQDLAPEWLRRSWETAEEATLDQLSMDDIDAEIAAARRDRRKPQPGE
jgi:hypothetical protein